MFFNCIADGSGLTSPFFIRSVTIRFTTSSYTWLTSVELLGIQSITSLLQFLGEFGILKYVLKGAGPYIRNMDNVDLFSDLYSIIAKKENDIIHTYT